MKHKTNRLLALLLALAMVFTMFPATALAEETAETVSDGLDTASVVPAETPASGYQLVISNEDGAEGPLFSEPDNGYSIYEAVTWAKIWPPC